VLNTVTLSVPVGNLRIRELSKGTAQVNSEYCQFVCLSECPPDQTGWWFALLREICVVADSPHFKASHAGASSSHL
jgi:hypothetical protein